MAQLAIDEKMEFRIQSSFAIRSAMGGLPVLESLGGNERSIVQSIECPAQHSGQDGRGGFIDVDLVLQCDSKVAQDKKDDDGGKHGREKPVVEELLEFCRGARWGSHDTPKSGGLIAMFGTDDLNRVVPAKQTDLGNVGPVAVVIP